MEDKPQNLNSKPLNDKGEELYLAYQQPTPIHQPREAQINIHTAQMKKFCKEQNQRLEYTTGVSWEVEVGETPTDNGIALYCNFWATPRGSKESYLAKNLSHIFTIDDVYVQIEQAWKTMFQEFIKAVNGGLFQKSKSGMVGFNSKPATNITSGGHTPKLDK